MWLDPRTSFWVMYPEDVCEYLERNPLDVVVELPSDMYTGRSGEIVCCDIRPSNMIQYYKVVKSIHC
jgi:hypothetical protein